MNQAIQELEQNINIEDRELLLFFLNKVISEMKNLSNEELATYSIDFIIKDLLRIHKCGELIEKIPDLLPIIRDPRNFYNELEMLFEDSKLTIATLMLIYELSKNYNFEYEHFYEKLENATNIENVNSDGFIFFLLQCLENKNVPLNVIKRFLHILSSLSVNVSSSVCLKLIYSILVIMRMHPVAFKFSNELKELYILAYSFEPIYIIVKRIFIESSDSTKRPKQVFLDNFLFPEFNK